MAETQQLDADFEDPLAKEAYDEQDGIEKEPDPEPEEPETEPDPEEGEPEEEEAEPEEEEPEPEEEPEEKAEDEVIRQMAIDESLTVDEAKEKFEARKGILEKYKNDPIEMAKALQSTQSAYDKTRTELEKIKSQPEVDDIEKTIERDMERIPAYVNSKKDELIEQYRQKYPRKTENMSDELILEEVTEVVRSNYQASAKEKLNEIKSTASRKREELLSGLNDKDREFLPEVKAILQDTPDVQVLSKAFDIMDLVYHARGQKYTPEYIEQVKREAAEKGKEEAKIIGEKVPESGSGAKVKKSAASFAGTQKQKDRAQEMFPTDSLEKAIENYKDLYREELKKDPKFVE